MRAWLKNFGTHCTIVDGYQDISSDVSLRLITFTPAGNLNRPAVVFVAGWVSQIEGWKQVLTEMTHEFSVYYIETREKVSSKLGGNPRFDVRTIGDDLVRLVQRLRLKDRRYIMFGSSLGATVILDCYNRLESKPSHLVLIAPNAEFRMPLIWKMIIILFYPPLYFLIKPWVKWYLKVFRMNVKKDTAQYEKYCRALDGADPRKLKPAALAFSNYKIWPVLQGIDVPVLICGGSHDKLHEPENLKQMVENLNHAEYIDLETNTRTHSEEVVREMIRFIEKG
jgi:pimeloyl-ACP methyl ester carboxylesterase